MVEQKEGSESALAEVLGVGGVFVRQAEEKQGSPGMNFQNFELDTFRSLKGFGKKKMEQI